MTVEYASLSDVKDYLEIPQDMNKYDNKLNLILSGVNDDIEEYTGEGQPNSRLKLAACKWTEFHWNRTTGADSESDEDVKIQYTDESIPPEVKQILDRFVDEDSDPGGAVIENIG